MISSATHNPLQISEQNRTPALDQKESSVPASTKQPSQEEQAQIRKLKARDLEVRSHEQAHLAAGGQFITGGPSYSYQQGPDGQRYAVGGEVGIDTSPEADPEATIRKMRAVQAAALAPAKLSGQDQQVAAAVAQQAAQAQSALAAERQENTQEPSGNQPAGPGTQPGEFLDLLV